MQKKTKRVIKLSAILIFIPLAYFGINLFKDFQQLMHTIFPNTLTVFNYDMEPVHITISGVEYSVPKAYINWKAHLKGGALDSLLIWASLKDDMAPWPLSGSFKRRDKSSVVRIEITKGVWEPYRKNFPENEIEHFRNLYKDIKITHYEEFDQGIYKNIFRRYDQLSREGKGSNFYLVPQIKTIKPFLIKCPFHGNPQFLLCTVQVLYSKEISYNFMIPLRIVENYLDYDQKVQTLVDRLKIKK